LIDYVESDLAGDCDGVTGAQEIDDSHNAARDLLETA
jgi:hypothetical protein